ncbi:hypothetical protein QWI17_03825 [Gilvimarinus sp. SDUM040013]|uniref:DUF6694 family lipoprotein n=1 Tax=Gilvimarinus gilvus TaxID=3058038 RepID=A0ABU4S6G1_9GAMM|nr:DUF6694 family lipoprotein [Gilvimarinus sp. SDUM040013]MDO3384967.1 hypothetical protein [Gilvimarinus sp. SDUM040013]MDX6851493.1 DUF6694 family lipoprotein [Gilvimarinus sp. SDUM040013]
MKYCLQLLSLVVCCALLSGCGEPTLDASSQESIEASVTAMMEELDDSEQTQLQQAIGVVVLKATTENIQQAMNGTTMTAERIQADMYTSLDGKTAQEIIDYAAQ